LDEFIRLFCGVCTALWLNLYGSFTEYTGPFGGVCKDLWLSVYGCYSECKTEKALLYSAKEFYEARFLKRALQGFFRQTSLKYAFKEPHNSAKELCKALALNMKGAFAGCA